MTLKCAQFEVNDNERPLRLKDVWDTYSAFSGIMERRYDGLLNALGFWTQQHTGLPALTYNVLGSSGISRLSAIDHDDYEGAKYSIMSNIDFPSSYVVELDYYRCAINLVLFASTATRGYHVRIFPEYLAGADPDGLLYEEMFSGYHFEVLYVRPDDSVTVVYRQYIPKFYAPLTHIVDPAATVTPYKLKVSARSIPKSFDSTDRTVYIGVWANDCLLFTVSHVNSDGLGAKFVLYEEPSQYFVSVQPETVMANLYVSALSDVIEYASLDPGETPDQGIKRAQEDRYILSIDRLAGHLKVIRPHIMTPSGSISRAKTFSYEERIDSRQVLTDIRLRGPFHWVRYASNVAIEEFGHRFDLIENTSLWSPAELLEEAEKIVMRSMEAAHIIEVETVGLFLNEPEDMISVERTLDIPNYLLSAMSFDLTRLTHRTRVSLRKYFWNAL